MEINFSLRKTGKINTKLNTNYQQLIKTAFIFSHKNPHLYVAIYTYNYISIIPSKKSQSVCIILRGIKKVVSIKLIQPS